MMQDTARAALITLVNMPGFPVLLDIFELQVIQLEQAVFHVNPANTEEVLAAHKVAVAARWVFENAKKQIEYEAQPPHRETPLTQKEKEDLYIKSLQ